jgi:predicted outer membrane protein
MLHRHWGRMAALAVAMTVVAACARDEGETATGDSAALSQTAGGDVAGTMLSPAAVTAFLSTVNQGEIEAGQLAQEKATNAQVRQFAQMMVRDHRQADSAATGGATPSGATAGQPGATAGRPDSAAGHTPGQPAATSQPGSTAGAQGNLATVTADMHSKHQQLMTSLRNTARGRGFDSTYMAAMVTGHQEVLQQLQQMRSGIGNTAGGTTPAAGARTDTGARAATGTTQSAGTPTAGTMQSNVESAVQMVQRHLERAQEIQRALGGNNR